MPRIFCDPLVEYFCTVCSCFTAGLALQYRDVSLFADKFCCVMSTSFGGSDVDCHIVVALGTGIDNDEGNIGCLGLPKCTGETPRVDGSEHDRAEFVARDQRLDNVGLILNGDVRAGSKALSFHALFLRRSLCRFDDTALEDIVNERLGQDCDLLVSAKRW